ncbi:MAG: M23 family metallopeptidase [Spirochaetes bacterium]|jgi:murein DD-endopeptidase MepM/ murein hydrolase activator NlpD|nr:M23 family metallopeptidase [Spirochaetota bacterium]
MKDKVMLLYIILAVFSASCFTLFAATGSVYLVEGFDSLDGQLQYVEDTLLIDTLEMNSEDVNRVVHDEDQVEANGSIIYDDNFIDNDEVETIKKVSVSPQKNSKKEILKELQRKDYRWHVSEHTIKEGENIWNIARKYGVSHTIIITYNNITTPDKIRPCNKIGVPNKRGIEYDVKKGDTLSEIALTYKVPLKKAKEFNKNRSNIKIGQKLFLPDATKIVPKTEAVKTDSHAVASVSKSTDNRKRAAVNSGGLIFNWPLHGAITSSFGMRRHPITGNRQFHNGIDIRAGINTTVRAAEAGQVIYNGWKDGYGKMIVVKHKNNYITVYAHLNDYVVKNNDKVKKGERIGLSGNTGLSTGPHLHFEIRKYETPLNPARMIK